MEGDVKEVFLYKGNINKEYLEFMGLTEDEARRRFSDKMQESTSDAQTTTFGQFILNKMNKRK